jgi:DNA-binding NarL/FixJ family response regulator
VDAKVAILIVDDDAGIRRMLRRGFERDGRFGAMAEAGSVAEAVAWARVADPRVAVINQMLPDGESVELVAVLRRECPRARLLMFSAVMDGRLSRRALAAGADACFVQGGPLADLLDAAAG